MFVKILQNSQEITSAGVSFLKDLLAEGSIAVVDFPKSLESPFLWNSFIS